MMLSPQNLKMAQEAENIFNSNVIGPICFVTPELGRWSTVGGLGIMVDELSQGLQSIGQEVIMISPYYNQNRKGQSGYLNNDPFNIHYIRNVGIDLDGRYEFGVHYGEGNGGINIISYITQIFFQDLSRFWTCNVCKRNSMFCKSIITAFM